MTKFEGCGSAAPVLAGGSGSGLVLVEDGRVVGGQLAVCGSGFACAWCGPWQWGEDRVRLQHYAAGVVGGGGGLVHSVLTWPHRHDGLVGLLGVGSGAWGRLLEKRDVVRWRGRLGVVGQVRVLHVTWSGSHDLHPHYHVVWFTEGRPSRSVVAGFGEAVSVAWADRAAAAGCRSGSGRARAFTELVRNAQGIWEYIDPDDPRHPVNDCSHPDHEGCSECEGEGLGDPDEDGLYPGDPRVDGLGYEVDPLGHPVESDDDEGDGGSGGRGGLVGCRGENVLAGVGMRALEGDLQARAVLRAYILGTKGRHRVSESPSLRARFGLPVERVSVGGPGVAGVGRRAGGGGRLWVHPRLLAVVQGTGTGRRRVLLNEGLSLAVGAGPEAVARLWARVLGRTVRLATHVDGCPCLGFPEDLAGHRSVAAGTGSYSQEYLLKESV